MTPVPQDLKKDNYAIWVNKETGAIGFNKNKNLLQKFRNGFVRYLCNASLITHCSYKTSEIWKALTSTDPHQPKVQISDEDKNRLLHELIIPRIKTEQGDWKYTKLFDRGIREITPEDLDSKKGTLAQQDAMTAAKIRQAASDSSVFPSPSSSAAPASAVAQTTVPKMPSPGLMKTASPTPLSVEALPESFDVTAEIKQILGRVLADRGSGVLNIEKWIRKIVIQTENGKAQRVMILCQTDGAAGTVARLMPSNISQYTTVRKNESLVEISSKGVIPFLDFSKITLPQLMESAKQKPAATRSRQEDLASSSSSRIEQPPVSAALSPAASRPASIQDITEAGKTELKRALAKAITARGWASNQPQFQKIQDMDKEIKNIEISEEGELRIVFHSGNQANFVWLSLGDAALFTSMSKEFHNPFDDTPIEGTSQFNVIEISPGERMDKFLGFCGVTLAQLSSPEGSQPVSSQTGSIRELITAAQQRKTPSAASASSPGPALGQERLKHAIVEAFYGDQDFFEKDLSEIEKQIKRIESTPEKGMRIVCDGGEIPLAINSRCHGEKIFTLITREDSGNVKTPFNALYIPPESVKAFLAFCEINEFP